MALNGKEIYRTHDAYGPIIVMDQGQKRFLSFGNGEEQSCQVIDDPSLLIHEYNRVMLLAMLFEPFQRVTMLGLGGGTLAQCLWQRLTIPKLHVVELRESIYQVARKYFAFPRARHLHVTIQDAVEYMEAQECGATDLILSDIFTADGFDLSLYCPSFLLNCHGHLSRRGWMVINCWLDARQRQGFIADLQEVFQDVRMAMTQEGNCVIFAGKNPGPKLDRALELSAYSLSERLGFSLLPLLRKLKTAV